MADEAPKVETTTKARSKAKPAAAPAVETSKPVHIREDY